MQRFYKVHLFATFIHDITDLLLPESTVKTLVAIQVQSTTVM